MPVPNIPQAHPRLWPADRLNYARQVYAANPWTPDVLLDHALLALILPDPAAEIRYVVDYLMNFTLNMHPDDVGSDSYRNNWQVPFALDAVWDHLTADQQATLIARLGGYVRIAIQQPWGTPAQFANNFFTGYLLWQTAYAVATWYEAGNQDIWNDVDLRWGNFSAAVAPGGANYGGAMSEGSSYGEFIYWTMAHLGAILPDYFVTNWWGDATRFMAYWVSPRPIDGRLQPFVSNDVEHAGDAQAGNYLPDFLLLMQLPGLCGGQPEAGYAATTLARGLVPSKYLRYSIPPATPQSLDALPLDGVFGSCACFLQSWDPDATRIIVYLHSDAGAAHTHCHYGSFQVDKAGDIIIQEYWGYTNSGYGFADSTEPTGQLDPAEAPCHSLATIYTGTQKGLVGYGPAPYWPEGWPIIEGSKPLDLRKIIRAHQPEQRHAALRAYHSRQRRQTPVRAFTSTPTGSELNLDLTPQWRSTDYRLDRPWLTAVGRYFNYDRPTDTLTVRDTFATTPDGSDFPRRFHVHIPGQPPGQYSANLWIWWSCEMTTVLPADPVYEVIYNGGEPYRAYRLDVSTLGDVLEHELTFS